MLREVEYQLADKMHKNPPLFCFGETEQDRLMATIMNKAGRNMRLIWRTPV